MRFAVLTSAMWFAVFALMHLVQMVVVVVPVDLQPALTRAWAVAAAIYAPIGALIATKSLSARKDTPND